MRLHASCVAVDGHGVLILGAAGSGKSGLALQLMAFGAMLVSDDQTEIRPQAGWPVAQPVPTISGRIEARGIGILAAHYCTCARIALVVDLDRVETDRLPPQRTCQLAGQTLPLLHKTESAHFAAAILQYLRGGRVLT